MIAIYAEKMRELKYIDTIPIIHPFKDGDREWFVHDAVEEYLMAVDDGEGTIIPEGSEIISIDLLTFNIRHHIDPDTKPELLGNLHETVEKMVGVS